jgi:hypothetical protein
MYMILAELLDLQKLFSIKFSSRHENRKLEINLMRLENMAVFSHSELAKIKNLEIEESVNFEHMGEHGKKNITVTRTK